MKTMLQAGTTPFFAVLNEEPTRDSSHGLYERASAPDGPGAAAIDGAEHASSGVLPEPRLQRHSAVNNRWRRYEHERHHHHEQYCSI